MLIKKVIHPSVMLQKRALRVISNKPYNRHTDTQSKALEILN